MGRAGPFSEAALEANRGGALSADQSRHWRRYARRRRMAVLKAALFLAGSAVVLFALRGSASHPGELAAACAGAAAVAVLLVVVAAAMGGGAWALDAREGIVSVAEGAIHKDDSDYEVRAQTVYVGGMRLNVGMSGWDAAPSVGYVRAFYLPRTKWIVNLERLPDHPLPVGDEAKRALRRKSLVELRSPDLNVRSEARSALAALGESGRAQFPANPVPPPPSKRDPRPLAQAVCGAWSNAFMTVEFSADGTVTVTSRTVRTGHWSVNRAGRLVADLGLGQADAEAWVSGERLTIISGSGKAVTFTKVTSLAPACHFHGPT